MTRIRGEKDQAPSGGGLFTFPIGTTNHAGLGCRIGFGRDVGEEDVVTRSAEATAWPTAQPIGTPTMMEPCARGHIPLKLNQSVGGSYGAFAQGTGQRLADGDLCWLSVT
jgi:hypothetical protein